MKLLKKYEYLSEAEDTAKKLESKGIVTFVSSKQSNTLSTIYTGAFKVGLWVVLNHQYKDAYEYLRNKDYKITSNLSTEEIATLKKEAKLSSYETLNKFLIFFGTTLLCLVILIYFLVQYFNGI